MTPRAHRHFRRKSQRGNAMVEMVLLAPVLVAIVFWSQYFWEVSVAKIKAAEVARFIAFERTVRSDPAGITAEAQNRWQDLDGSTRNQPQPTNYKNRITLTSSMQDAAAPFGGDLRQSANQAGGGINGIINTISGLIGTTVNPLVNALGFNTNQGAVRVTVTMGMQNGLVPERIGMFQSGRASGLLDLTFRETFFLYHDTWRAWQPGDSPANTYATVEQRTRAKVRGIAYLGLANGSAGGVLNAIGDVLSVLGLDFPFNTNYINGSTVIRQVTAGGTYGDTRTVPGDRYRGRVWMNDNSALLGDNSQLPVALRRKTGFNNGNGYDDQFHWRSYNCRGNYMQGTTQSNLPEGYYANKTVGRQYFTFNANACQQ